MILHQDYHELKGSFDLAIYDPPFDIWDTIDYKVEAKTYICFTNFQNRHHVERIFGIPRFEAIWHFKDGRWVSHKLPRLTHESILIYGDIKNEAYVGEYVQDRTPQRKGKAAIGRDKNLGDRTYIPHERKMLNSVIEIPRNVGKALGVWGKPESLAMLLLEWLACEGDTVWDGFAGSGTFARVSESMNLKYSGCDINAEYVREANQRMSWTQIFFTNKKYSPPR